MKLYRPVMKSYTWYGVLTEYTSGSVTAIAGSVDEARSLIIDKWSRGNPVDHLTGAVQDDVDVVMNEEPDIEDLPCVIECHGSA